MRDTLSDRLLTLRPYKELAEDDFRVLSTAYSHLAKDNEPAPDDIVRFEAGVGRGTLQRLEQLKLLAPAQGRVRPSLLGLLYLADEDPTVHRLFEVLDGLLRFHAERYRPRLEPMPLDEVARELGWDVDRLTPALHFLSDIRLGITSPDKAAAQLLFQEPTYRSLEDVLAAELAGVRINVVPDELLSEPGPFDVRVESIEVDGYRALQHFSLRLPSPLTVLVGVNSVGKSTALDALGFASRAIRSGLVPALEDEGGLARLRTSGRLTPLRVELGFSLDPGFGRTQGRYSFVVSEQYGHPIAEEEELAIVGRDGREERWVRARRAELELLTNAPDSPDPRHAYKAVDALALSTTSGHPRGLTMASVTRSIWSHPQGARLRHEVRQDPNETPLAYPVRQDLSRVVLVDRDPLIGDDAASEQHFGLARTARRRHAEPMRRILADAIRSDALATELGRVLAEFVPTVQGVRRVVATDVPPMFLVEERGRSDPSTLEELSAGTRQMLLLAALYVHPAPPSLVLLEEPDAGLHVGALPALRDLLRSMSRDRKDRRGSVVIATSHSPAFVSLLDARTEVVALTREPDRVSTQTLAEARESKRWLEQFESPFEALMREGMVR